jgi:hypothetical protein
MTVVGGIVVYALLIWAFSGVGSWALRMLENSSHQATQARGSK